MSEHLSVAAPNWVVWAACGVGALAVGLLVLEVWRMRAGIFVLGTGIAAVAALLLAIVRPERVQTHEVRSLPTVTVLVDASRSMALPGYDGTRFSEAQRAVLALTELARGKAELRTLVFGSKDPEPWSTTLTASRPTSQLDPTFSWLQGRERSDALVVISDGRLDTPLPGTSNDALAARLKPLGVPIHTVNVVDNSPRDAHVRSVSLASTAVAHVPVPLRIEVGCTGGLSCGELDLRVRELRDHGPAIDLSRGVARVSGETALVEMSVTLDTVGHHVLEVSVAPPPGDSIPENNRRLFPVRVTRERVRVLHVAGRPTHDVRAVRDWLKSNASIDTVAFFILRTHGDNSNARDSELSLIPFPVDELFTQHLLSFDAIIFQDFDAQPYGLDRHLQAIAAYVNNGGGLVMVGGPNSFVAGGYAGTALASVLPVGLEGGSQAVAAEVDSFVPAWTDEGRAAPLLGPLRGLSGDELPSMPGTNILGDLRPGASALWTHPSRRTRSGRAMPVFAIGEVGNGRSVALGIDGGWLLGFSTFGLRSGGRATAALWDGLLGWLMRDPRYEPVQIELPEGCVAGEPLRLELRALPGLAPKEASTITLDIQQLDGSAKPIHRELATAPGEGGARVTLDAMPAGGYAARARFGNTTSVRRDFACEVGGQEWADPRPAPEHMRAIASAAQGISVSARDVRRIPLPQARVLTTMRRDLPLLPPWAWALAAATLAGTHWIVRRRTGLL
jgi:uncharacterized membrane protein